MCGIFAIFSKSHKPIASKKYNLSLKQSLREIAYQQSGRQRHRGPDDTGVHVIEEHGVVMIHERLSIIGPKTGHQPFLSSDENIVLIANGEIYNYTAVAAEIAKTRSYSSQNDCRVIIELYKDYKENLVEYISGMFAFVLYDKKNKIVMLARDPIGIIPMYKGQDSEGNLWISSEMKCLYEFCEKVEVFPPGTLMIGKVGGLEIKQYFQPIWFTRIPKEKTDLSIIREKLESAVRTHLQCNVQFAALLSGGVDSSLIASIATKIKREQYPNYRLKTFSVGMRGAPDLKYSNMVADFIGSDHTELHFTIEEGLDCIRDVIYKLETYDVATVRCSIPMFLLIRFIKSKGIKMLLSGEGSDEIFGGYLYLLKAPNYQQFQEELVSLIKNLPFSDVLRVNKTGMAWGVEARVPFLDKEFINYAMSIKPEEKIPGKLNLFEITHMGKYPERIEKYILRAAFADGYLPEEVLWRQKEEFSDGVGYSWIDSIRKYANTRISDIEFENAANKFPINTPSSKEEFYYRTIFEEIFLNKNCSNTVRQWSTRKDWGCAEDPSGHAQKDFNIENDS